ncbi:thiamine pyrophosphate-binding protein [Amycolatopsis taiwanensis]|uniref:thiamine pyrophosphate-binding protein n=1 Tax=Amycolatopsis taiwanensis TaxID=342230 RepID=UPI000484A88D|nr:thiamine pyrophosphate-binding protein [Amycolatopsis taiwanensis]
MTAAARLLETLAEWGIGHVFCCPGTSEIPVLDAIAEAEAQRRSGLPEFVLTTHEAISVSMADGYARASGRIGVAYLHTNVGVANGLAHLYAAQVARSSVAILAGVKGRATLPHRALTTSPRLLETAAPYVGHAWQNLRAEDLLDDVARALWRTTVVPEQPAILTIPQDHLAADPEALSVPVVRRGVRQGPDAEAVRRAIALLLAARRPVVVAGSDVARRGAEAPLERLAERLGAPVFVESRRDLERWAFRTDHPSYAGLFEPGAPLMAECDLLVLAGMPTPLEFSAEVAALPAGVPILHLSEDPAEPGRRYIPVGAVVGDTAAILGELAEGVIEDCAAGALDARRDWLARVRQDGEDRRARWFAGVTADAEHDEFSAAVAMRNVADVVGGDRLLVLDGVTSTLPLLRFLQRTRADSLFTTASGSLGWGMGAAAGVAMARRERVLAIVGDGVVQFGVPALWTAVRYRLPVTYLVVNNGRYQAVVAGLSKSKGAASARGQYPLTDISGVDISTLARAFGVAATTVDGSAGLRAALGDDLALGPADGPRLIEARVNDQLWQ